MEKTRIARRQLLLKAGAAGVGAVGALAVAGAPAVHADSGESEEGFVGSWLATVVTPGQPDVTALTAFVPGGVVIEGDTGGGPSPTTDTPGFGMWAKTGDNRFDIRFIKFSSDSHGVAKVTITSRIKLTGKDTFSGTGTLTVQAYPSGPVFVDHQAQTISATRITLGG